MRAFRGLPVSILYSPVMANATCFERDFVYSSIAAQDDWHCLPFDAATLRSVLFPTRPFVALKEIAAVRDKFVARGVYLHKTTARKEWLEIHPEYRHNKGERESSFGDYSPEPEQAELCLAMAVAPAKRNRSRAESKQSKATDSERELKFEAPKVLPPPAESGNQERGHSKEEPGRFAQGPDAFPEDPLWVQLCRTLGLREMFQNGDNWKKRFLTCRDALAIAVRDYASLSEEGRKRYSNAAAYITTAFENEKANFG